MVSVSIRKGAVGGARGVLCKSEEGVWGVGREIRGGGGGGERGVGERRWGAEGGEKKEGGKQLTASSLK